MKNLVNFLIALSLAGAVLVLSGFMQVDSMEYTPEQRAFDQAMEKAVTQAENTAQNQAQNDANTVAIAEQARMSGTQDFILKLLAIMMPLLTAVLAGVILFLQQRQKTVNTERAEEARENLILIARSINGIKTELVARSELAAFLEGATKSESVAMTPEATARAEELRDQVRRATKKAEGSAEDAINTMSAKKLGLSTIPLHVGEQKVVEGVANGEQTIDPDAIGIETGEIKAVLGKSGP